MPTYVYTVLPSCITLPIPGLMPTFPIKQLKKTRDLFRTVYNRLQLVRGRLRFEYHTISEALFDVCNPDKTKVSSLRSNDS